MTDPQPASSSTPIANTAPTPWRCFRGAFISGGLAFALYSLTQSIVQALAKVPLPTKSTLSANIAVAVRTLVVGVSTMATAIFAIATLGLLLLGIQLLIKNGRPKPEES
ncbi:MAG: DUF3082 domain-containing protein [Synechococcales cyanobacterium M58_A2018_015]|nr:DUF3082 domain-containing protein [Synechococcales cyanobacterium M58_A2018_015]